MTVIIRKIADAIRRTTLRHSMSRTITIAIGIGVIAILFIALARNISAERAALEQGSEKRAGAALDMLSAVHTQAMRNRRGVDDRDGAIGTLNGTMDQFSHSGSDVSLWVVMGPKVIAFQRSLNAAGHRYDLELAHDEIDRAAIQSGTIQRRLTDGIFRETRPVVFDEGVARAENCGRCHAAKMGIQPGEVIGAYSASVDLTSERAELAANIRRDIATSVVLAAALIALMIILLRVIALRPLELLTQSTNHLARGSLDIAIDGDERPDEIGDLARALQVFQGKLVEKRQLEKRNAYLARHDEMTGLPNRVTFVEQIHEEILAADGADEKIAIVGIDLNGFKDINDRHGHATGDALLIQLAKRARRQLDEDEVIARFGGDEFVAAKRFTDPSELSDFLDRIEKIMTQPIKIDTMIIVPGASLGVALYPADGTSSEQLIANADLAMYRAKADSNTNICHYEAAMDERARERRALSSDLRTALHDKQFAVHYQVQTCIRTGAVIGYEALLRWQHPEYGAIAPSEFVAIAEQNGEIVKIGDWVLKTACAEAASWDNELTIAVNLSAVQLNQGDLARSIHEVLLATGLPARRLELEITETAIVANRDRAIGILRMVKALGVSIAIDDFGSGYSSLGTLNAFPFDKIKMDSSFLLDAERRPESRAIIRAIVAIGNALDVPVLAEGVENEFQRTILLDEGCHEAQGFFYGRPQLVPESDPEAQVLSLTGDRAEAKYRAA